MQERDPIKVYDARWEEGEFSESEILRLFEAAFIYGRSLGVDTVTLSRDARLGAAAVMELGVAAALRAGIDVYLCTDPISTPQSYFLAAVVSKGRPATMGLTVTASHNPGSYIGLKLTVPTVRAIGLDSGPEGGLTRVREIYHGSERISGATRGRLTVVDLTETYLQESAAIAAVEPGGLDGVKVVMDSFNGSAGTELYRALQLTGASVSALRLVPDGRFPTGAPNPTSRGKMDEAVAIARGLGGGVVIGVDGDGDRLVFGDGDGVLSAGFASVALLESDPDLASKTTPVPVLFDPKVNPIALEEWRRYPVRPVLFRNGHSQIKDYMMHIGARFGAEESGHYYHRLRYGSVEVNAENSIVTVLRFLKSIHSGRVTMRRLRELERRVYSTGEINYQFDEQQTVDRAMRAIVGVLEAEGARSASATSDGIDLGGTQISKGVRLDPGHVALEPGWYSGYIRSATNERAVLRSFFSAGDSATGRRILDTVVEILSGTYRGTQIE